MQYILDRMSATLRKMGELNLFSAEEIKHVVKSRRDFEYLLIRRELQPSDFYSYLRYEINLDKLRIVRCSRNEKELQKQKEAVRHIQSSFMRHICYIFDRATRRFPDQIEIWNDYILFLKEKKSSTVLNAVFGKVLALYPKNENLWYQAAIHELEKNNNTHAARVLLQSGLRANKNSKIMWKRYFELELWNAIKIMERKRILGVTAEVSDVEAAPSVVFKHALLAIPELHFGCELHKCAFGIANNVAKVCENMLREKFVGSSGLWIHMIASQTELLLSGGRLETGEQQQKKRGGAAADRLRECVDALEGCVSLVREGVRSGAAGLAAAAPAGIRGTLEAVMQALGRLVDCDEDKLSRNMRVAKKRRLKQSGDGDGDGDEDEKQLEQRLVSEEIAERSDTLHRALRDCGACLLELRTAAAPAVLSAATLADFSHDADITVCRHLLWRLLCCYDGTAPNDGSEAEASGACGFAELLAWAETGAAAIERAIASGPAAKNSLLRLEDSPADLSDSKALLSAVSAWLGPVRLGIESASRSLAAAPLLGQSLVEPADQLLRLCQIALRPAEILASFEEGEGALVLALDALASLPLLATGVSDLRQATAALEMSALQRIAAGPLTLPASRGDWAMRYLGVAERQEGGLGWRWLAEAWQKSPTAVAASRPLLGPFFVRLLRRVCGDLKLAEAEGEAAIGRAAALAREVGRAGLECCPWEAELWTLSEATERALKDHAAADRIRWRAGQSLRSV